MQPVNHVGQGQHKRGYWDSNYHHLPPIQQLKKSELSDIILMDIDDQEEAKSVPIGATREPIPPTANSSQELLATVAVQEKKIRNSSQTKHRQSKFHRLVGQQTGPCKLHQKSPNLPRQKFPKRQRKNFGPQNLGLSKIPTSARKFAKRPKNILAPTKDPHGKKLARASRDKKFGRGSQDTSTTYVRAQDVQNNVQIVNYGNCNSFCITTTPSKGHVLDRKDHLKMEGKQEKQIQSKI